jgi:hypothetical protein
MPDITAAQLEPLYRPIGELIVNWSVLDSQFIKMIAILYQTDQGKALQKQLPREFSRRLRFLRKCATKFPALSRHADDLRRALTVAKEVAIVRDALVHGAISNFDETDQRYSFVKLDVDKSGDIHMANTVRMTRDDINAHVVASQDLMAFAIKVTDHLVQAFP